MTAHRPKILAIDDNPQNLVTLATALELDFDFQLTASGLEGLALAAVSPPDLILLDVMMPDIDGFETCRRFKADPRQSAIPIIFMTALSDLGSEVSGLALGGADYITKPINIELVRLRIRNLLQLTQLTKELKSSEERLRLVMESTGDGIWDWNLSSGTIIHNRAWCQILGLDESFVEHQLEVSIERVHPEDLATVKMALNECLSGSDVYISEHRLLNTSGQYLWVSDRGKVVERDADGAPLRMVGSMFNIERRKRNEAEIQQLAFFDPLTALPNRRLMMDRLQRSIIKNQRDKAFGVLMFLDMDRFKLLNDMHGHAMGDELLTQVAARLQACLRENDTVARLGGDEFVVMLECISDLPKMARTLGLAVGDKILEALNKPYMLGQLVYHSTPSIGLTIFSGNDDNVDKVLKRADMAMYRAKSAGRNTIRVFDDEDNKATGEPDLRDPIRC